GMMGSIALSPDKANRAPFASDTGTVGYICREHCFDGGLIMRHVGDRMIISPPLVITHDEVDTMMERAVSALDKTYAEIKSNGLNVAG
ncbi:MAG: putrescine aminotransferase, partial [Paracoccaceae bacterium]